MNLYEQWLDDLAVAMDSVASVAKVQREPKFAPEAEQMPQITIDEGVWPVVDGHCGCWEIRGSPTINVLTTSRASRSAIVREVLAKLKPDANAPLSTVRAENFKVLSIGHDAARVSGGGFTAKVSLQLVIKCKRYALDEPA